MTSQSIHRRRRRRISHETALYSTATIVGLLGYAGYIALILRVLGGR